MNKETLRMQMLAGVITESQYKQRLNENNYSVVSNDTGEELISGGSEDNLYSQLVDIINQDPEMWDLKITNGGVLVDPLEQDEIISTNAKQWIMDRLKGEGIGGTWILKETNMNKETLRMQMLAGIITENQYRQLLEDMEVVDRILDKISAQGKDSLTPEEKSYLDKYSRGEKNLIEPTSGEIKVYTSSPYVELYKIENFPSIPKTIHSINFDCADTNNPETCENSDEMQELFNKSPKIKSILSKIKSHAFGGDEVYFHEIDFDGDFSSPIETAYAQVSGDGMLYIVDSLSQFSDNYQTEEGWGVESWSQI